MMQKDEKLENSELLTSLESQLWHSFDILRKENVSSDNYHIILFLTLLHKEGFLNGIIPSKPDVVKDLLEDNIEASKGSEIYKSLFQAFKPVIDDISNEVFYKLVLVIDMLDQNALAKCLPSLVDNLIHKISKARSRYGEEYIQPYELTKLLCELADMPEGSKVYNPYAGLASFGIELNGGQDYLGQEINRHIWAIGLIRLLAHNRSGQTRFLLGDSVHNWNPSHEKFDLIIATPPFGMRLRDLHDNQFGNIRFADHLFLLEALESLTPKGKIVAVVPQSILFRIGAEEYLRRRLIEQDLLETVISFPGGIFSSTAISVAAVIINKEKSRKGSFCFVDASKFVKSDSAREKRLDYKSLITSIVSGEQSDVIKHVSSDSIRHFKYNLDVPRYLLDQVEGVPLGELAVVVRGIRVEEGDVGRFVRIRDLSDDRIDYQINSEEVEPVSVPRNVTRLAESALLLALRWKSLKPTYFNSISGPILITPDIIALKLDETRVDIDYLVNELHAEYLEKQLDTIRTGSVIPLIRRQDLMSVKIVLPPLSEQKAKVKGLKEAFWELKKKELADKAVKLGIAKSQFNEFASLKHTLGTPRQNVLSYAEALITFFDSKPSHVKELICNEFKSELGQDLMEVLSAVRNDINFISEILEKGENGLVLEEYETKVISLNELLKFVQDMCKNHNYNFVSIAPSYIINAEKVEKLKKLGEDKLVKLGIKASLVLLRVLIDNIFSNAHKHGFESKPFNSSHNVFVEVGVVEDKLFIDIVNDGKPFPKNFTKEKFITKYSTTDRQKGSGLGGYDIDRIVKYLGGDWSLRLNEDPVTPVQFNFYFPLETII